MKISLKMEPKNLQAGVQAKNKVREDIRLIITNISFHYSSRSLLIFYP